MNSEEFRTGAAQDVNLTLEPQEVLPRRPRRRWGRRLFLLCFLGAVAYGGLLYLGQAEPVNAQLLEWKTRGTQMALDLYARLPYLGTKTPADKPAAAGAEKKPAAPGADGKPAEAPVSRPTPVVAIAARKGNMGVYLSGLGSVTASNTVTVRTRIDGQLIKVAFQEGQMVRQGDLLAEIDPLPLQVQLSQAEGQLAKDEALLKNAKIDMERYKVLLAQDSVAKQQLDTQVATVSQYEGVIKSDVAQVDHIKLQLLYTRITAPLSGRIGLRLVDQGNMVRASDPNGLAVIMQVQPIAVLFNIPADDLPTLLARMRTGQQLAVEAYDRNLKKKLATGTLLTIDNQIDANTGTIRCKAMFPNEDSSLFPNQFVNVRLLVDMKKDVSIVPSAAIQRHTQATFVYVVKDDSTVDARNVVLGPSEGNDVALESGVAPGEVVVVEGLDRLQRGSKVAARLLDGAAPKGKP